MGMVVAAVQSSYIPWRGYFDLIRQADVFVFLDSVQFSGQSWRNRNYLRQPKGRLLITVPVHQSRVPINQIEIAYGHKWQKRHLKSFGQLYARAPYRREIYEMLETAFEEAPRLLIDLTRPLTKKLWQFATNNCSKQFIGDEELQLGGIVDPNERLIEMCRQLGATTYLSGPSASGYMDPARWLDSGINLRYIDYSYAEYPQLHEPFEPFVSIVDALANLGPACLESILQFSTTHSASCSDRRTGNSVLSPNESL